jgi:AraC family transcriptional regulator
MNGPILTSVRRVEPLASGWRTSIWHGGRFDSAGRGFTRTVEGTIRLPQYLVLATLQGGADELRVRADCGHRFQGPERTGAISLVPPHCERRLRLVGVRARWASIAIDAEAFGPDTRLSHCFSNVEDPFIFGALQELDRLQHADGCIDASYGEAMSAALARYVHRRYGGPTREPDRISPLSPWQLSKVEQYVEAHLAAPVRLADLARLTGYSEGHFHRAFRRARGVTPLEYVNHRRVQRAERLLRHEPELRVLELAERVGYTSAGYFARVFRRLKGVTPSKWSRSVRPKPATRS